MEEFSTDQLILLVILTLLVAFLVPIIQKRTGKSLSELFLGSRLSGSTRKKAASDSASPAPAKKQTNGTQRDLTVMVSQLLNVTRKNKMQLVSPGTIEYGGETARLLALAVHPSGVTGIYCLGFGGIITPSLSPEKPWKQLMNGQEHTFENPLKVCDDQYRLVRAAMDQAGIRADLNIVAVFTNDQATLKSTPQKVYTRKEFFRYLSETSALKNGNVDTKATARALADLAHIAENKKEKKQS